MQKAEKKSVSFLLTRFNSLELITIAYSIITTFYILFFFNKIENPSELLLTRVGICIGIIFLAFWNSRLQSRFLDFIRMALPLSLIMYWYPETYYLNRDLLLPNLDGFFDKVDYLLFGCSPAMEFSALMPQAWFSEIMYFAYFSFFLFYIYIGCYLFFKKHEGTYSILFSILMSFMLFYVIFIFIPVEGPQFYYSYPDNQVPDGYLFSKIMRYTQSMGEKPTGAFPSSHIGMTLIYMWILFRHNPKVFWITLPIATLLFFSTVYIKAHYLIDVVAGFIFAPIIYWISLKIYSTLKKRFPALDNLNK